MHGLTECAKAFGIPLCTTFVGGMFGIFFTEAKEIKTFADVKTCDVERFKKFFHIMLKEGVYLAPSAYEAGFVSSMHGEKEVARTLAAAEKAFDQLKKNY
jgi:glutamate-1-semialdehyde 2,1-aminomutase